MHALILRHAFDPGVFRKLLGGFEDAVFAQVALDIIAHFFSGENLTR
jgi:hypothetical protein